MHKCLDFLNFIPVSPLVSDDDAKSFHPCREMHTGGGESPGKGAKAKRDSGAQVINFVPQQSALLILK